MNRSIAATLLLLASTLAVAGEPEKTSEAALTLAYNANSEVGPSSSQAPVKHASQASADRVLERTLGLVSANLSFELDERIAGEMPIVAR